MKFNLRRTIVKIIFLSSTVITFNSATAQTIDYSLIVGEWSFPKMCEQKRYIYTDNGQYIWIEKKEGVWQTEYQGNYVTRPEFNGIVIAEEGLLEGFSFEIIKLNKMNFILKDLSDGITLFYQRCPNR
jgi:hypothetical protein